jgi:hypothetical protein
MEAEMNKPFEVHAPRELHKSTIEEGGWLLLGGRDYICQIKGHKMFGKPSQAAHHIANTNYPENAKQIDMAIAQLHKHESDNGLPWYPVVIDEINPNHLG